MGSVPKSRGEIRFWRNAKGRWLSAGKGQPRRFAKAPTGKYLDRHGRWRDARKRHAWTSPPARFAKKKPDHPRPQGRPDNIAADRITKIFREYNGGKVTRVKAKAVQVFGSLYDTPRSRSKVYYRIATAKKEGAGFRAQWTWTFHPERMDYADLSTALFDIAADKTIRKIFGGRHTVLSVLYDDPAWKRRASQIETLSNAVGWELAINDAAIEAEDLSERYKETEMAEFYLLIS